MTLVVRAELVVRVTATAVSIAGLALMLSSCTPERAQHESVPSLFEHWTGVWELFGEPPDKLDGAPSCVANVSLTLDAEPLVERYVAGTVTWCGTSYGVKVCVIPHSLSADKRGFYGPIYCLMAVPLPAAQAGQQFGKWMFCVREDPVENKILVPSGTKLFVSFDPVRPYPGGGYGYEHTLVYVKSR